MTWSDVLFILPEIVLSAGACLLLLIPTFGLKIGDEQAKGWMLGVLALTAGAVIYASHAVEGIAQTPSFGLSFALDPFAVFFKLLFIAIIAIVTLISVDFLHEEKYSPWEYYSLVAFALVGMMFMASGIHLVSIYVGLELMSLSSYILAGYYKNQPKSTEAAMKYFVLGAVSSGILLYGISLIYGVTGSLQLTAIKDALEPMLENDALVMGIVMLAAGLCFKIAAVPFHVWTPDVYEGAPTPITAFLSTASKGAAFAIFARIFYMALPDFHVDWSNILAVVAALSMILGNLAAITQDNVKRMLAYSSIAHAGYGLLGIVALSELGMHSILVYMLVYALANLGIWTTVLTLRRHAYAGESVADFEGLNRRAPYLAFAMVVFLLSLGGIPPTAGFIGKYYLFAAAVKSGFGWLAIIAVLMSAVSMFYYFRLVVAMYLKEDRDAEIALSWPLKSSIAICLAGTLLLGLLPEQALRQVKRSAATVVAAMK
ncbi:MAG TPA: NADH-quinone oxidoreductase subunit N [Thermoanaerobaculia bacterium]